MGASVETTEAAPEGIVFGSDPFGMWWYSCPACALVDAGKAWSETTAFYNAKRHLMTNRHIKNTTPKTQPETAQEAQEPHLRPVTLYPSSQQQWSELLDLLVKWLYEAEEGKS